VSKCTAVITSLAGFCEGCSRSYCNGHAEVHVCQKKEEGTDGTEQDDGVKSEATSTAVPSSNAVSSESSSHDADSSETAVKQILGDLSLETGDEAQGARVAVVSSASTDENWWAIGSGKSSGLGGWFIT